MTTKTYLIGIILMVLFGKTFGQHLALAINDANRKGISIQHLNSIYKSAVHADTSQAIFKTEAE